MGCDSDLDQSFIKMILYVIKYVKKKHRKT